MKFINTTRGLVNARHVVSVARTENNAANLFLMDGTSHKPLSGFDALADFLVDIIPNTTPLTAIEFVVEEDEKHFSVLTTPIIGWRVGQNGAEGLLPNGDVVQYLLYPDGRIEHLNHASYKNLAEARKAFADDSNLTPRQQHMAAV